MSGICDPCQVAEHADCIDADPDTEPSQDGTTGDWTVYVRRDRLYRSCLCQHKGPRGRDPATPMP